MAHFEDVVAHPVEEITVVGDHKQCKLRPAKIGLQPFNHINIQMVSWLIEDQ